MLILVPGKNKDICMYVCGFFFLFCFFGFFYRPSTNFVSVKINYKQSLSVHYKSSSNMPAGQSNENVVLCLVQR